MTTNDDTLTMKLVETNGGYVDNGKVYDIQLKCICGKEFNDLTQQDVFSINTEYIKTSDEFYINKDDKGTLYMVIVYIDKKQIDLKKLQLRCEQKVKKVIEKYRADKND